MKPVLLLLLCFAGKLITAQCGVGPSYTTCAGWSSEFDGYYPVSDGTAEWFSNNGGTFWDSTYEAGNANTNYTPTITTGVIIITLESDTCISSFELTVEACGTLPVTLTSFFGSVGDGYIQLNWQTANEINCNHFVIEARFDSIFIPVGVVAGNDNSTTPISYGWRDNAVVPGHIYYYRLKQVDNNNNFTYSDVIAVAYPDNSANNYYLLDELGRPVNRVDAAPGIYFERGNNFCKTILIR